MHKTHFILNKLSKPAVYFCRFQASENASDSIFETTVVQVDRASILKTMIFSIDMIVQC